MSTSPPKPRVLERVRNHAVGVYGDVVIAYAFQGSVDDPRHVAAVADAVRAEADRRGRPVRLLLALPEAGLSRPPSAAVRTAVQKSLARHADRVAKVALVVGGEGFGPAIHRAVISGFSTLMPAGFRPAVVADVRGALDHLLDPAEPRDALLQFCEQDLAVQAPASFPPPSAR